MTESKHLKRLQEFPETDQIHWIPSLQEYINSKDGGESLSDKPNCEEYALSRAGAGSRDQSSSLGKDRDQSRCLEEGHIK